MGNILSFTFPKIKIEFREMSSPDAKELENWKKFIVYVSGAEVFDEVLNVYTLKSASNGNPDAHVMEFYMRWMSRREFFWITSDPFDPKAIRNRMTRLTRRSGRFAFLRHGSSDPDFSFPTEMYEMKILDGYLQARRVSSGVRCSFDDRLELDALLLGAWLCDWLGDEEWDMERWFAGTESLKTREFGTDVGM